MALLLVLPALFSTKPARAEDVQAAKGAAADRRAEFKETAQKIKQTGKTPLAAWSLLSCNTSGLLAGVHWQHLAQPLVTMT